MYVQGTTSSGHDQNYGIIQYGGDTGIPNLSTFQAAPAQQCNALAYAVGYVEDVSMDLDGRDNIGGPGGRGVTMDLDGAGDDEGDGDDNTITLSVRRSSRHHLPPPIPPARTSSLRPPVVNMPYNEQTHSQGSHSMSDLDQSAGGLPSFQVTQPTPTKTRLKQNGVGHISNSTETSPTPAQSSRLPHHPYSQSLGADTNANDLFSASYPSVHGTSMPTVPFYNQPSSSTPAVAMQHQTRQPAVVPDIMSEEDEEDEQVFKNRELELAKKEQLKIEKTREQGRRRQQKKRQRDKAAKEANEMSRINDPSLFNSTTQPIPSRSSSAGNIPALAATVPLANPMGISSAFGTSSASSTASLLPLSSSTSSISPTSPFYPALPVSKPVSGTSSPNVFVRGQDSAPAHGSSLFYNSGSTYWDSTSSLSPDQHVMHPYQVTSTASRSAVDLSRIDPSTGLESRKAKSRASSISQAQSTSHQSSIPLHTTHPSTRPLTARTPDAWVPIKQEGGPSASKRRKSEIEADDLAQASQGTTLSQESRLDVPSERLFSPSYNSGRSQAHGGRDIADRPDLRRSTSDTAAVLLDRQNSLNKEPKDGDSRSPTPPPLPAMAGRFNPSTWQAINSRAKTATNFGASIEMVTSLSQEQVQSVAASAVHHLQSIGADNGGSISSPVMAGPGLTKADLDALQVDLASWLSSWVDARASQNEQVSASTTASHSAPAHNLATGKTMLSPSHLDSKSPATGTPTPPARKGRPRSRTSVATKQGLPLRPSASAQSSTPTSPLGPYRPSASQTVTAQQVIPNTGNYGRYRSLSSASSSVSQFAMTASAAAPPQHSYPQQLDQQPHAPVQRPQIVTAGLAGQYDTLMSQPTTPSNIILPTQRLAISDNPSDSPPSSQSALQTPSTGQGSFPHQQIRDITIAHGMQYQETGYPHARAASDPQGTKMYIGHTESRYPPPIPYQPTAQQPTYDRGSYSGVLESPITTTAGPSHKHLDQQLGFIPSGPTTGTYIQQYIPDFDQTTFGYSTPARSTRVQPSHPQTQPIPSTSVLPVPFTPPSPTGERYYSHQQQHTMLQQHSQQPPYQHSFQGYQHHSHMHSQSLSSLASLADTRFQFEAPPILGTSDPTQMLDQTQMQWYPPSTATTQYASSGQTTPAVDPNELVSDQMQKPSTALGLGFQMTQGHPGPAQ